MGTDGKSQKYAGSSKLGGDIFELDGDIHPIYIPGNCSMKGTQPAIDITYSRTNLVNICIVKFSGFLLRRNTQKIVITNIHTVTWLRHPSGTHSQQKHFGLPKTIRIFTTQIYMHISAPARSIIQPTKPIAGNSQRIQSETHCSWRSWYRLQRSTD